MCAFVQFKTSRSGINNNLTLYISCLRCSFILPVGILMFMLDSVAKPLPHEKYPLVTYKTITTNQILKHRRGKIRITNLSLKYLHKINL